MDRKSWKEWMSGSNSVYIMLPFAAMWAVAMFFEKGVVYTCLLGIAAAGSALLAVRDYLDERRTNRWLDVKPEGDEHLTPFESETVGNQVILRKTKAVALGLLLAEIAAGFLSLTASGAADRISALLCCLLPVMTLALYLTDGRRTTMIGTESGFGRIFGREKVCLLFHFCISAAIWVNWLVAYDGSRGITLLDRTKWYALSVGIAIVLTAVFLLFSHEYRTRRILAALAIAMSAANAFALVWVVNVECDALPSEVYEVVVTDTHLEERLRSIGAHYEDYLTLQYDDGSVLDLYEPYDFDDYTEGDRLRVKHHRGLLGIEWAEFVRPVE